MKNEKFYLEAYEFISGLIEQANRMMDESSNVISTNYADKFKNTKETIQRCIKSMEQFLDRWETYDERLCGAIKRIKGHYLLYIITLDNSSPTLCYNDSKYIVDSLYTSKQVFQVKLKKIKEKFNE